ncbi:uncharacterized protein M6B38_155465 [Iris pallida]|uniref:UspA domain-containing protein n=1 Tax=Iris pallida TaxID=29817 RepID=A0AAX6F441_IRIPA|nr:uncharacterized protein M6B38_155465 [Iris pallida]
MGSEANGESFLRQLSLGGDTDGNQGLWNYSSPSSSSSYYFTKGGGGGSKRWGKKNSSSFSTASNFAESGGGEQQFGNNNRSCAGGVKKRVIVVIDSSARAKQAMMWAVTHIANRGDLLTLLHVIPHHHYNTNTTRGGGEDAPPNLANSLASLCKACKPQVEVEALVIQGSKLATVLSQVKKLEAAVLVLSQSNPSPFCCLFRSSSEEFVEQCINKAECLTLAVRKQSKGVGGYLVSTRWQKNFWLLA